MDDRGKEARSTVSARAGAHLGRRSCPYRGIRSDYSYDKALVVIPHCAPAPPPGYKVVSSNRYERISDGARMFAIERRRRRQQSDAMLTLIIDFRVRSSAANSRGFWDGDPPRGQLASSSRRVTARDTTGEAVIETQTKQPLGTKAFTRRSMSSLFVTARLIHMERILRARHISCIILSSIRSLRHFLPLLPSSLRIPRDPTHGIFQRDELHRSGYLSSPAL